jgi:acyl carrier protein
MSTDKTSLENENQPSCLGAVRQRCFSVVNIIAPETEMDENVKGWLDDLDFVEIVMQAELEFDCTINEGETRIDDFEKVSDLVDWLVNNVA